MGYKITKEHKNKAWEILESAFQKTTGSEMQNIWDQWQSYTLQVMKHHSKTHVPFLGTALLAYILFEGKVDLLSIKESAGSNAYSARSLCHEVLVPFAYENGLDLRTGGREPLNNQPFFGSTKLSPKMRVKNEKEHSMLISIVEQISSLTLEQAQVALAAFLRCVSHHASSQSLLLHSFRLENDLNLNQLFLDIEDYLSKNSEGGKIGQALVAAAFGTLYPKIEMGKINDPSRRYPGDIQIYDTNSGKLLSVVEVRQKEVRESDAGLFVRRIAEYKIHRAYIVDLTKGKPDMRFSIRTFHGQNVILLEIDSFSSVLLFALHQISLNLIEGLERFIELSQQKLREIGVGDESIQGWLEIMSKATANKPTLTTEENHKLGLLYEKFDNSHEPAAS